MNKSLTTNIIALSITIYGMFSPIYSTEIFMAGLFALSGKLTSFIGPLLVSTITFLTNSQRIGFSTALILLVLGLIILLKVKDDFYS